MVVSGQLHVPAAVPAGKVFLVPIGLRQGGSESRSGRCGEKIKHLSMTGIEYRLLDYSTRSLVTIPTELCRFPLKDGMGLYVVPVIICRLINKDFPFFLNLGTIKSTCLGTF
jgi:hypothetical protein